MHQSSLRLLSVVAVFALVLAACGGGAGPDDGDGEPDGPGTTTGGDFDPDALTLFGANGSSLSRIVPADDTVEDLVGDLTDCFEAWYLDGSVWVSCSSGRLLRVDPGSGEVQLDVETGEYIEDVDVGEGAIWVLNGQVGLNTVINKLDPSSGEVLATVTPESGGFFEDVAVGEGAVWAVGGSAESTAMIARIDPASATVTTLIDTGMGPARVAAGYGSVYAVGGGFLNVDGSGDRGLDLVRIDPVTNEVAAKLDVSEGDGFPDLALAFDAVWLTDTAAGELVRVDKDVTEVVARIAIGTGGQDFYEIDVARGLVWAANPFDGEVHGIDPSTNEFEIGVSGATKGVAFRP